MKALLGAMNALPGAMKALPGAMKALPGAKEVFPGAKEIHSGTVKTWHWRSALQPWRPSPWSIEATFVQRRLTPLPWRYALEPWRISLTLQRLNPELQRLHGLTFLLWSHNELSFTGKVDYLQT
jgi:hypothetical protein